MKRPNKTKFEVVRTMPPGLVFLDEICGKGSIYVTKLNEALTSGDAVQITAGDAYMKQQLKMAAKKLKVKLVYAIQDDSLFVKPVAIDGERKRLMLLLREPRSISELEAKKLELHLNDTLASFNKDGLAHLHRDKWVLIERGLDAIA